MEMKQYLPNYSEFGYKAPTFFNKVLAAADQYDYVVIAGTSCFNFACYYFEDYINFTSSFGLLSISDVIADYFIQNKRFPRILIVSDIAIGCCEILKFIELFEGYVYKEIPNYEKIILNLRKKMANSIDIMVFALNIRTLLYGNRLDLINHNKIISDMEGYSGDLRNIAFQFYDVLPRYGFELTTFSPSIINEKLKNTLVEKTRNKNEVSFENNWTIFSFSYYEEMIFACKFYSNNHVATIRLFPNRGNDKNTGKPWITSHTILGNMKEDSANKLINLICNAFNWGENTPLGKLLSNTNYCRNHLLNLIISIFDLIDFISANNINDIDLKENSLDKISKYFGINHTEILEQLNDIISNTSLVLEIKERIDAIIATECSPVLNTNDYSTIKNSKNKIEFSNKIIDSVNKIIWRMSANQNNSFFTLTEKPYLFIGSSYQDYQEYFYLKLRTTDIGSNGLLDCEAYSRYDEERYGRDGVITFYSFFDLLKHQCEDSGEDFCRLFPLYLAGYFMLEDLGMVESSMQTSGLTASFVPLVKTTTLSLSYFPKRVSWLILALAKVESRYCKMARSELDAVIMFYHVMKNYLINSRNEIIQNLNLAKEEVIWYDSFVEQLPSEMEFEESVKLLYAGGTSFRGWNNANNVYYPNYKFIKKMKEYIKSMTYQFFPI